MLRAHALVDDLWREVSHAVRGLLRNKGFAAIAIATVAIGVGASAAIFTLVDTVVFRSLPYDDPSRLVEDLGHSTGTRLPDDVSWADFVDLTAQQDVFEGVAADDGMGFRVRVGDGPLEAVGGAMVTAAWLDTLGVKPLLGRGFLADDFAAGSGRVALLAHTFWVRRFGSDPAAVGRTIVVDDEPFTIIGVLPPNVLRFGADVVRPLIAAEYPQARSHRDLDVVARLKPGVTIARAQAALDTVARRLARDYPDHQRPPRLPCRVAREVLRVVGARSRAGFVADAGRRRSRAAGRVHQRHEPDSRPNRDALARMPRAHRPWRESRPSRASAAGRDRRALSRRRRARRRRRPMVARRAARIRGDRRLRPRTVCGGRGRANPRHQPRRVPRGGAGLRTCPGAPGVAARSERRVEVVRPDDEQRTEAATRAAAADRRRARDDARAPDWRRPAGPQPAAAAREVERRRYREPVADRVRRRA